MKTLLLLSLMCVVATAAELPKFETLTVGTMTYRSVVVTAVEPSGIRFAHAAGAGRVKFEDLDAETRKLFPFDPVAAKAFEEERTRANNKAPGAAARKKAAAVALAKQQGEAKYEDPKLRQARDRETARARVQAELNHEAAVKKRGATWTTLDGTVYQEVDVREVEAEHVVIRHREGVTRVLLTQLQPALREAFKEDSEAARKAAPIVAAADAQRRAEAMKAAETEIQNLPRFPESAQEHHLKGGVVSVWPEGVVIFRSTERPDIVPGVQAFVTEPKIKISGRAFGGTVIRDGVWRDPSGQLYPKYRQLK